MKISVQQKADRLRFLFQIDESPMRLISDSSSDMSIPAKFDHTNQRIWPVRKEWKVEYVEKFVERGAGYLGGFILWHMANLDALKPGIKTSTVSMYEGRYEVTFLKNIHVSPYYVSVDIVNSECQNADDIAESVVASFDDFNVHEIFQDIVETYLNIHPDAANRPGLWDQCSQKFFSRKKRKPRSHYEILANFTREFYAQSKSFDAVIA